MRPSNLAYSRVDKPDAAFVEAAVNIFVGLMEEDPLAVGLTGGDISLLPMLCRVMVSGLVLAPGIGEAYAATDEHGVVVGFLAFSLPGQLLFATEESRAHGFYDYVASLSESGKEYFLNVMAKLPPDPNEANKLEQASYWCNFAFIRADYQGKGVAKTLFQLSFQRGIDLNEKQMALIATNPKNLPIYKAIGFDLIDHKIVSSQWNDCNLWFLYRENEAA
ncbi:hypothetical protein PsYK624_085230 [Phanerochaete sordida]|uniref:N-acetyltransferase domain-containing protein n=1 Tax=Phanerochaete sordida TaxID=48140 RepID=A0A9P3GDJ4_9APHY|nr:hypothetical protein PsYK624_085230 [Phanerochaete sordida]